MASTQSRSRARRRVAAAERDAQTPPLLPQDAAWLLLVPCAAVVLLAMLVLGPPLGKLLFPAQPLTFWPLQLIFVKPEPTEQARFLIALTGPVLLAGGVLWSAARGPQLDPALVARLKLAVQVLGLLTIVVCLIVQRRYVFGPFYLSSSPSPHTYYFTIPALAVALALALAAVVALPRERVRARLAALGGESRAWRVGAAAAAVVGIALWLPSAINTDGSIGTVNPAVAYHVQFTYDETYAVLDGRAPLGDFAAQYGSLWPYVVAAGMAALGTSIGVLTVLMSTITGLAMLAMYGVWRRVARSAALGLLLFVPFLATSFYMMRGPLENRYSLVNLLGAFPLRYAGPFFVAWLLARHLDGAWPRRAWPLFAAAGLALLNNADLGLAALGAAVAGLLLAGGRPTRRGLRDLAGQLGIGLVVAFALVSAATLARAGTLPHLELLFRYSRLFAVAGFGMLTMKPVIGLSTLIYLTHVAAIATATVRATREEPDRLLTGLLAWAGVFGLGAGAYYMGRSHPEVLINTFPAWALSVGLLTLVALRSLVADAPRIALPQLAVLFAFGLTLCSVAQVPTPWSQVERLRNTTPTPLLKRPFGQDFVAAHTRPGERVLIFMLMGHRMAVDLDIDNVSPYTAVQSMPTIEQLEEAVDALRDAGGRKVFIGLIDRLSGQPISPELIEALPQGGFRRVADAAHGELSMWIDSRAD
jgi:hypothetical protein